MEEFVEHLMYAWLCATDSKMNRPTPAGRELLVWWRRHRNLRQPVG